MYRMSLLIIQPSFLIGNIGDAALMKTIIYLLKEKQLIIPKSSKEANMLDITPISALVYFVNDCLAYYGIEYAIINRFIKMNKKVIMINTSWGENPKKENVIFLNSIKDNPNFYIYIRDTYSLETFERHITCKNKPELVADLAILCKASTEQTNTALSNWMSINNKPIIGINIHRDFGNYNNAVVSNIRTLIENNSNYRYLFIPHDTRKKEYEILTEFKQTINNSDCFVSSYLDPEYEKSITSKLHIVISGRMHLSVLSLPNLIPCILIAYNGLKAKGTLSHFGLDNCAIEPKDIETLPKLFKDIEDNYNTYVNKIKSNIDNANTLAMKQIDMINNL